MGKISDINEYIEALKTSSRMGHQVAYHITLPGAASKWSDTKKPLPEEIINVMNESGINRLYKHQADAVDIIRSGHHVVVSTPTASGKTFIYNIPVIEKFLNNS